MVTCLVSKILRVRFNLVTISNAMFKPIVLVNYIRMLFVTISVQLVQRIPCQGSSGWAWRLQHRRANYSNCEICR